MFNKQKVSYALTHSERLINVIHSLSTWSGIKATINTSSANCTCKHDLGFEDEPHFSPIYVL